MEEPPARSAFAVGAEFWAALFWLALGIYVVWAGHDLGIGTAAAPGSGFLPFWAGLLICAFAIAILSSAITTHGPSVASLWHDVRWGSVAFMIGSLAVYTALLDVLGFLLATIPLLLVLLRGVDPVRWRTAIPIALLSTVAVWWVLKRALLIQLPVGIFEIG